MVLLMMTVMIYDDNDDDDDDDLDFQVTEYRSVANKNCHFTKSSWFLQIDY